MKKNKKLEIFVVTHKDVDLAPLKLDKCYKKLLVGSYNKNKNDFKDYYFDCDGKNISEKNGNYCELTGLYWIWNNIKSDYVGLCHYRRFFTNNNFRIINEKETKKILNKYDIILPVKVKLKYTIYEKYKMGHYISDIDKCREIILEEFPDYIETFDDVFSKKYVHFANMFIMRKELVDDYSNWLFTIFNKLEKMVDVSDRDAYQQRIFGFISERLFRVWVLKNNLKIYESVPIKTDDSKFKFYIKTILNKIGLL